MAYYNTRAEVSAWRPVPGFCKMTTVAIVGAGDIGGSTAQALASCDRVRRVWLIDAAADAAVGKALDLQQAGAVACVHTRLAGTDDETRLVGCTVCVVADRFGVHAGEWQGEEGLSMLMRIAPSLGDAPIVFAGASQVDLLSRAADETRIPRERLIGSSTEALASAITAIVAMEAGCSPREVMLTVLGTPPDGFVVPWSEASIGGYALQRVLSQVQIVRVETRAAPPLAARPLHARRRRRTRYWRHSVELEAVFQRSDAARRRIRGKAPGRRPPRPAGRPRYRADARS